MAWYPGAWAHDYKGTGVCNPDSVVLHEVVNNVSIPISGAPSNIAGWVSGSLACQWYVDYAGSAEQFCDSRRAMSHAGSGNGHRSGVETQDDRPLTTAASNAGSWKAPQLERLADLCAWFAFTHNVPLRQMQTSRRADIGIGYHRLGVPKIAGGRDGWPDGELWTSSPGKPCPGNGRIAQVPGIVARAQDILAAVQQSRCTWLPRGPVNLKTAYARTGSNAPDIDIEDEELMSKVDDLIAMVRALHAGVNELPTRIWINPITSDGPGGHANELLAAAAVNAGIAATAIKAETDEIDQRLVDLPTAVWTKSITDKGANELLAALVGNTEKIQASMGGGLVIPPEEPQVPPGDTDADKVTYTVVGGDTLGAIAAKLGVSLTALMTANPQVKDPDAINVGDVLSVPKA
jgi:LysM repeat protein